MFTILNGKSRIIVIVLGKFPQPKYQARKKYKADDTVAIPLMTS